MRKITKDELDTLLTNHALWLSNNQEGERADLSGVDLSEMSIRNSNLSKADFRGANLRGSDLSGSNLSEADLRGAYLMGAQLSDVNLYGANLSGADLSGTYLLKAINFNYPISCPEEGSFIGFKKCDDDLIVKLEITSDAIRSSSTGRECRCSKAKVMSITNIDGSTASVTSISSKYNTNFVYSVGETVEISNFDMNRWDSCTTGIHFFLTRREAVDYSG